MVIHFYIRYTTRQGESLALSGTHPVMGGDLLPMQYLDNEYWHIRMVLSDKEIASFNYRYHVLTQAEGVEVERISDWEQARRVDFLSPGQEEVKIVDTWNPASAIENAFLSQPFRRIFLKRPETSVLQDQPFTHLLRVKAPSLEQHETVCLLGHGHELHDWDTASPMLLTFDGNWWSIKLNLPDLRQPLSYKYGIWNSQTNRFVRFEDGPNRPLYAPQASTQDSILVRHDGFVNLPPKLWRGAGIAIPVFSLRSEKSFGIGEFLDLIPLADWAKSVGLRVIQLLPINDTTATYTWRDSYPYSAISAFALHPAYLNLEEVAGEEHKSLMARYEKRRIDLNAKAEVDYNEMIRLKWDIIRQLYDLLKADLWQNPSYQAYYNTQKHWLAPYAVFCWLRDQNGSPDFSRWKKHSQYDADEIERLIAPESKLFDAIGIHLFVQYHLHRQLEMAADYANSCGLALKGDIPIGIYRYSCDAWQQPELYNMDTQAGAPPDDFTEAGQNWGFPTYNWEAMKATDFSWWRKRFEQMSFYFDAFRIDHILGFFRIWTIPFHAVDGLMGRFVPAIPVMEEEFHSAGIGFSFERLCRPYITDDVLRQIFRTEEIKAVKETFLIEKVAGRYDLRPEFDTQREIMNYFDAQKPTEENDRLRAGLRQLVSNVILFPRVDEKLPVEERAEGQYDFRFDIEKTTSFKALDPIVQSKLKSLYVDYYFHRQDEFWRRKAMEKLPALKQATNMLVCGEDLGLVPETVPGVMRQLGILSLEVQRMPKMPGSAFFHPKDAPYLAVVTPSTHDMSTIRGWWEENPGYSQRFFNEILGYHGRAPYFCEPWIVRGIIEQHLYSPAMLAIFQLQDLLGTEGSLRRENPHDERINNPANPEHYWQYRMHLTLEALKNAEVINRDLRAMVTAAGR